ncbi:colicin [Bacillus sp. Xin]|uniref:T7SS effector LXG polymorphic toxin n=1 Tax=unclassified Bacillus (in: firmicutes) TaxID=185979 RepID=UPI001572DC14|nr:MULTISPECIES: T7SS effector LXG polymorphic toxin [unclassified Bacillus (in: firmicutes)]MBC6975413.1 colicin [Bacillus sp. Xin]NSW37447.1 colicin [Bacillus sp. Xin1]
MSLNMYLGEVHTQTQSMNAICTATIQGMEQAIQSIDAFVIDTVLQGQTYDSAKTFFVQTFRPLAQGIIYLCEELIVQNNAFPSQFQSKVASTDVIEQEILEQIQEIDRMKASMEAITQNIPIPGMDAMTNLFTVMRKKLQERLDHLYQFNQTSSNNYSTAIQLAASIATGLAEVQSGKGFSLASGTFSTQELNMEWTTSIQAITEEKARKADHSIKDGEMCGRLEEKSSIRKAWDDKVDDVVKVFERVKKMWNGTVIGSGKAVEDEIKFMETLNNMDIGTFINVTYAILHLDETTKNMWHTFSNSVKRDLIDGDAESRTQWTTYGLTQIAIGLIADKGLGKAGLVTKEAGGASTLAKGVTLIKELKQAADILQSFKKDVSFAFSGGNIITKIPQSELNQAYYNFAKTIDSNARKQPGIASGGENLSNPRKSMRGSSGNIGLVPKDVADSLRGREFSNFDAFRKAFWEEYSKSSYANEFSKANIKRMSAGLAPKAPKSQHYGKQTSYVLHHRNPIHNGRGVYDLDNIVISSPRMHQEILSKGFHFNK